MFSKKVSGYPLRANWRRKNKVYIPMIGGQAGNIEKVFVKRNGSQKTMIKKSEAQ